MISKDLSHEPALSLDTDVAKRNVIAAIATICNIRSRIVATQTTSTMRTRTIKAALKRANFGSIPVQDGGVESNMQ